MDITGLNKAEVLAALYNNSKAQGMGLLHPGHSKLMTTEDAQTYLEKFKYFDYLNGRVMKIDLSTDELDLTLYNRDNGKGAGERIINILKAVDE